MMRSSAILGILLGVALSTSNGTPNFKPHSQVASGRFSVSPNAENNSIPINIYGLDGSTLVRGYLGMGLPNAVGQATECDDGDAEYCFQWNDFAKVKVQETDNPDCFRVQWTSTKARELEDCFDLESEVHWYGGGETWIQTWPIENNPRLTAAYVTGDFLQHHDFFYGGVIEQYWLLSNGAAVHVDDETPLYFNLNTSHPNQVCFLAKDQAPYTRRNELTLGYEWCMGEDVKKAHQLSTSRFFEKPTGTPDERMIIQPLWSTWAEYKVDVTQEVVLEFARRVVSEGFVNSSHIEIDDNWEICYGEERFSPEKFPNPKEMVDEIKSMNNMRVTAWVHPFINYGCPLYDEGLRNGYFVKNSKPRAGITWWWQGTENAGLIDTLNPDAVAWWTSRLRGLQEETGLTSFKFDAGETNWLPADAHFNNDTTNSELWPNLYTTSYVEACAQFGGLIETRSGYKNQKLPVFIRMLDKDSRWGYDNGLQSMIPTLLFFGVIGYPFVLPDMIGGNAYNGENPSQELYVRWMQVNIFMPAVQFSLTPWRIGETDADKAETVRICLKVLAEREKYADHIMLAAQQAVADGSPMNRPLWWADPTNRETYTIDDEYLLGDTILVAPVVREGVTSRDIYLPTGSWISAIDSQIYKGPVWVRNYPVPLDVVPFFIKAD